MKKLKFAVIPSALMIASGMVVVPTAGAQLATFAHNSAYNDAAQLGRNNVLHDQETLKALAPSARGGGGVSESWR